MKKSSTRCFYLEGYLYPSTYEFYKNTSPASVIETILKNTGAQYTLLIYFIPSFLIRIFILCDDLFISELSVVIVCKTPAAS